MMQSSSYLSPMDGSIGTMYNINMEVHLIALPTLIIGVGHQSTIPTSRATFRIGLANENH